MGVWELGQNTRRRGVVHAPRPPRARISDAARARHGGDEY